MSDEMPQGDGTSDATTAKIKGRRGENLTAIFGLVGIAAFIIAAFIYFRAGFYIIIGGSCIWLLATESPREVYLLFYTFFTVTCLSFIVSLYLHSEHFIDIRLFDLTNVGQFENGGALLDALRWLIVVATDAAGEFKFVAVFLGLALIPQALSFVFAGIFGCGEPPRYVRVITDAAILSLVKFYCISAAVSMGTSLCLLFVALQAGQSPYAAIFRIGGSFEPLFVSFILAALHEIARLIVETLTSRFSTRWVTLVRSFMVRNTEVELPIQFYERSITGHPPEGDPFAEPQVNKEAAIHVGVAEIETIAVLLAQFAQKASLRQGKSGYTDRKSLRIYWLTRNRLIEVCSGAEDKLYRDPHDGRLWELTTIYSDIRKGAGPPKLWHLTPSEARMKYGWPPADCSC